MNDDFLTSQLQNNVQNLIHLQFFVYKKHWNGCENEKLVGNMMGEWRKEGKNSFGRPPPHFLLLSPLQNVDEWKNRSQSSFVVEDGGRLSLPGFY